MWRIKFAPFSRSSRLRRVRWTSMMIARTHHSRRKTLKMMRKRSSRMTVLLFHPCTRILTPLGCSADLWSDHQRKSSGESHLPSRNRTPTTMDRSAILRCSSEASRSASPRLRLSCLRSPLLKGLPSLSVDSKSGRRSSQRRLSWTCTIRRSVNSPLS